MHFVVYILLAILLLLIVSGGYVFVVGCVRRKELPWLVEEEIDKTPYSKHYKNILAGKQFLDSHHATEVSIQSFDGCRLSGMWVPAKDPIGTILLAHGYRSNKLIDFGLVFDTYHNMGINILVPDQRAHGKSQGRFITFGVKESRDMKAWVAFHNTQFGCQPVILSGLSMGATTMLFLADEDLPSNVRGIIADCGFTSPWEILKSVFSSVVHLPAGPSLVVADLFAKVFAGFGLKQKDTRNTLRSAKLPVLLIHGLGDGFVPCDMTKQAYAACTGPKELLLVEGADHGVSFLVAKERYTETVRRFLKKYVGDIR